MSNSCTLQETHFSGFNAFLLENDWLSVCVIPELGGKITSILHLPTGRDWLWNNPYLPLSPGVYGASYVESFDTGGLDECFPAVGASAYPDAPWEGVLIPDHGELWSQQWEVELVASSTRQIVLVMVCYGVRFPYRFERTLTFTSDRPMLTFDYQVSNLTTFEMPFVWSIHPLIKIEEGMRVTLPAGVETVRLASTTVRALGTGGGYLEWPVATAAEIDLSRVPARDSRRAYKLFTPPLEGNSPVETKIFDPAGEHSLGFRFRPDQISHVGLWMNYGAWSGCGSAPYFNLGLEPCIGGMDALPSAKDLNEYAVLPAKGTRQWALDLAVT